MRRQTWFVSWLVAVGFVASCSLLPHTRLTTPGPPPSPVGDELRTFDESGITFAYPATWREFHYNVTSSFSNVIAYLATVDVPEPCTTTVDPSFTTTTCNNPPVLTPGSLVVTITINGFPSFDMSRPHPAGSTALTVDGLPAYLETIPSSPADLALRWTISVPGSVDNFYAIDAQMRGPGLDEMRPELVALVASLRYDPPARPLPSGAAAMAAAEASALAALVKQSPVFGCFSPTGPKTMLIDAMPYGPPLAQPQVVTCTVTIDASPLQMWRMALSIRLPKSDPNVGLGETTVQWINPDGSLGASIGGPLAP